MRFSPEGRPLSVYADGFRNPYDLDFDAAGHVLTVDSDGERDHHLPWYAPTRLFDVAAGMQHGWLEQGWTRGWNRPQSFFDNVERMVEIGRGSPTGIAVYRHHQFPKQYQGGVFAACWTLGRVYYFPLRSVGATCASELEIFMQTTGDVGFAPCDLAVGPQGDLFVAIGGRRTRGSVFRVRAVQGNRAPSDDQQNALMRVLKADQPLAAWSRAAWLPIARQLGREPFERAAADKALDVASRVRAVEIMVDVFGGLSSAWVVAAAQTKEPEVRARIAWALADGPIAEAARQSLVRMTSDDDPRVARSAWESLATLGAIDADSPVQPDWHRGLTSAERRVRAAAIAVAHGSGDASYRRFLATKSAAAPGPALRLAQVRIKLDLPAAGQDPTPASFDSEDVRACLESFGTAGANNSLKLEAVRLLQIALGDLRYTRGRPEVYTGYLAGNASALDMATRDAIARRLAPEFPTGDAELNRELARLLGMLGADYEGLLPAIASMWTLQSSVEDDLHYLFVASLLAGRRTTDVTSATARCLLALHNKLEDRGQFPSLNWPLRVGEAFDELCRHDPALCAALVDSPEFGHAEHALFASHVDKSHKRRASERLWAACEKSGQAPTSSLIALAGDLSPPQSRALLNAHWDKVPLRDAIVVALADNPTMSDRAKFIEALGSPQPAVVEKAAQSLMRLGVVYSPSEMAAALRALKQSCANPSQTEPRRTLLRLLEFWTEGSADVDEGPDPSRQYQPWFELFEQIHPVEAKRLKTSSGADAASWRRRLAAIDWSRGDAVRGREVFQRRSCDRCHEVSGHLGPQLTGAASRMSREDLFTAILDPDLEVSPTFQTTLVATPSGQVYHGLVVYESPEGVLLQTGPDTTVRITGVDQTSMRKTTRSLMPSGLLDPLSDGELNDLHAYLRSLSAK